MSYRTHGQDSGMDLSNVLGNFEDIVGCDVGIGRPSPRLLLGQDYPVTFLECSDVRADMSDLCEAFIASNENRVVGRACARVCEGRGRGWFVGIDAFDNIDVGGVYGGEEELDVERPRARRRQGGEGETAEHGRSISVVLIHNCPTRTATSD